MSKSRQPVIDWVRETEPCKRWEDTNYNWKSGQPNMKQVRPETWEGKHAVYPSD